MLLNLILWEKRVNFIKNEYIFLFLRFFYLTRMVIKKLSQNLRCVSRKNFKQMTFPLKNGIKQRLLSICSILFSPSIRCLFHHSSLFDFGRCLFICMPSEKGSNCILMPRVTISIRIIDGYVFFFLLSRLCHRIFRSKRKDKNGQASGIEMNLGYLPIVICIRRLTTEAKKRIYNNKKRGNGLKMFSLCVQDDIHLKSWM